MEYFYVPGRIAIIKHWLRRTLVRSVLYWAWCRQVWNRSHTITQQKGIQKPGRFLDIQKLKSLVSAEEKRLLTTKAFIA